MMGRMPASAAASIIGVVGKALRYSTPSAFRIRAITSMVRIGIPSLRRGSAKPVYHFFRCDGPGLPAPDGPAHNVIPWQQAHKRHGQTWRGRSTLSTRLSSAVAETRKRTTTAATRCRTWVSTSRAAADYRRALTLRPSDAVLFNNLGMALLCSGEFAAALEWLDEAVAACPSYRDAHHNRGLARAELGDVEGAIADMTRAIELDPDFWSAYRHRAILHSMAGNHRESYADYLRARPPADGGSGGGA